MKFLLPVILTFGALLLGPDLIAQSDTLRKIVNGDTVYVAKPNLPSGQTFTYVDQMPEPTVDISSFLRQHLRYPEQAKKQNIEGRVVVRFTIDSAGQVTDVRVAKSVHPLLDEEAQRVVRLFPKWKPGMQNGKPVSVLYTLPVSFRLDEHVLMALVLPRNGKTLEYVTKAPNPAYDLDSFIRSELRYPKVETESGVSGEVSVKCRINADGTVSHPAIVASVYPSLDEEALRLVNTLPAWNPAMIDREAVGVFIVVKVNFEKKDGQVAHGKVQTSTGSDSIRTVRFNHVEQMPEPTFSVNEFLQRNLRYPDKAKEENIQGDVIVRFVLDEEGNVTFVHTPKPANVLLDYEARRVVSKMPRWKPGLQNGKPVKVYFTLPITFRLQH